MKVSTKTKSPGLTSSCKDPEAVDTMIWVQPASFNAQILALGKKRIYQIPVLLDITDIRKHTTKELYTH